jgi:ribosome biogenesis GTPase / thiamine phosphate phosphatase
MKGVVVKNTGSWYHVRTSEGTTYECKIRGNLRLRDIRSTNPVAVGDIVSFTLTHEGAGLISEIENRRNYIIRRSSNLSRHSHILAANLDMVLLVVTVNYPETSTVFIDRFIASAEAYQVPACLVINKMDLYNESETAYAAALAYLYESLGYKTFSISATDKNSLSEFNQFLENKTVLVSGNSGVGKSTLINSLLPESLAKTSKISGYHNKGTHTTTFSEMYILENNARIIDTPGIKGFGIVDIDYNETGHYFKEIFRISANCKFSNCTHIHEPGCAVIEAVNHQIISQSRYQSYLSILSDFGSGKYR